MRTMQHNSRASAGGRVHGVKHNDRNFDVTLADNIDEERVHLNEYWHLYQDEGVDMTFEEMELRFYTEHFAEQLQQTNDKYLAGGHPERCKDMAAWKMVKRNAPEETTMQIGKMEEHIDGQTLMACFQDYNRRLEAWNEAHGRPFTQLSYALHEDEAVPHIQTRRVWHYTTDDGSLRLGQEKALEQAGVELPNPGEKVGRRNNRKMTFDAMAREMWLDVIHEHGIDVERVALPNGRHNRDKEDMIRDKYAALEQENKLLKGFIQDAKAEIAALDDERRVAEQELSEVRKAADFEHMLVETEAARLERVRQDLSEASESLQTTLANREEYNAAINRLRGPESPLKAIYMAIQKFAWVVFNRTSTRDDIVKAAQKILEPFPAIVKAIANAAGFENRTNMPQAERETPALIDDVNELIAGATTRSGEADRGRPRFDKNKGMDIGG